MADGLEARLREQRALADLRVLGERRRARRERAGPRATRGRGPRQVPAEQRGAETAAPESGMDRAPDLVGRDVLADDALDPGRADDPAVDLDEDHVVDGIGAVGGVHLDLEVLGRRQVRDPVVAGWPRWSARPAARSRTRPGSSGPSRPGMAGASSSVRLRICRVAVIGSPLRTCGSCVRRRSCG